MKAIKITGLVLLVLFLLYSAWAAFSPTKMDISKSIEVNKDIHTSYAVALDFNQFKQWNPWSKSEPSAQFEITGDGTQMGDAFKWNGEKIGQGSLTHARMENPSLIENQLQFIKPWQGTGSDIMTFEEKEGKTIITWTDRGNEKTGFFMRPLMDVMMGGQMEEGLENLKKKIEETPQISAAPADSSAIMN